MDLPWKKFDRRPKTVEACQVSERTTLPRLEEGKALPVAEPGDYVVKWPLHGRELLVPFEREIFEMEYEPQGEPVTPTDPQSPAAIERDTTRRLALLHVDTDKEPER